MIFDKEHEKDIPEHILNAIPTLIVVPNAEDMQYVTQAIGVPITPFNKLNELLNERQSKEITTIAIECWPEDISPKEARLLMHDVQRLVYTSRSLYIKLYIIVSSVRNVHPGIRKSCRIAEFRRKIDN